MIFVLLSCAFLKLLVRTMQTIYGGSIRWGSLQKREEQNQERKRKKSFEESCKMCSALKLINLDEREF